MFCPECGRQNRDTAKFCIGCGEPLQELAVGTVLQGRYRIDGPLGSGAMGRLFRVQDQRLGCPRALKVLTMPQGSDQERQEAVQRFEQEARIVSGLHHQALPPVQDFFSESGRHFLVQALIEGVNLEQHLNTHGNPGLPEEWVLDVALQLLGALEYLHQQTPPIIFRDLKPSNVMLESATGRVFLVDFGIAGRATGTAGTAIGTEGYAPPEQYAGKAEPRSDLYALAATMHHLLSGQAPAVPFHFTPIADLVPTVSTKTQEVLKRSLQLGVESRYACAADVVSSLRRNAVVSLASPKPAVVGPIRVLVPPKPSVAPIRVPVVPPKPAVGPHRVMLHSVPLAVSLTPAAPLVPETGNAPYAAVNLPKDLTRLGYFFVEAGDLPEKIDLHEAQVRIGNGSWIGFYAKGLGDAGLAHLAGISNGRLLTSLQSLHLSGTKITDAGLVHLKGLTSLQSLHLSGTKITDAGLVHLKGLTSLRSIDLGGVNITDAGLVHLKGLTSLQDLRLWDTAITDAGLFHLKESTCLQSLFLLRAAITGAGLVHLKGFTSLQDLRLWNTAITDARLVHLKGFTCLKSLFLGGANITDAGLVHLKGLTSLRWLKLKRTAITDAGLVHLQGLTSLRSLNLQITDVADAGLIFLKDLTSLQSLHLSVTKVTDAGLVHLKGLTSLRLIDLSGTKITDAGLFHLRGLTGLQTLGLGSTSITDDGLFHLRGLTGLQTLGLGSARITDDGLFHLRGLTSLQSLHLSGTKVTDAGLIHLEGLTSLRLIYLSGTRVTDAGLVHLKRLTSLRIRR